jgi:hypothetical protein
MAAIGLIHRSGRGQREHKSLLASGDKKQKSRLALPSALRAKIYQLNQMEEI